MHNEFPAIRMYAHACTHTRTCTHTHTHILRPSWILSRTTLVSQHQKGKTNLDLMEQEIVSGSGISWAICKSVPWPRHITMPTSHHSLFYIQDECPSCHPTNSVNAIAAVKYPAVTTYAMGPMADPWMMLAVMSSNYDCWPCNTVQWEWFAKKSVSQIM